MGDNAEKRTSQAFRRTPDFEVDTRTTAGLVRYGLFYADLAALVAGGCMTDHLRDERVVRDAHDIIAALGSVMTAFELLKSRAITREEGAKSDG
jgi:hypothetical protein